VTRLNRRYVENSEIRDACTVADIRAHTDFGIASSADRTREGDLCAAVVCLHLFAGDSWDSESLAQ
jgi:hypothetical protein